MFAAWRQSFIGCIWISHHALFRVAKGVDRSVLAYNLLLFVDGILVFTTATYVDGNGVWGLHGGCRRHRRTVMADVDQLHPDLAAIAARASSMQSTRPGSGTKAVVQVRNRRRRVSGHHPDRNAQCADHVAAVASR